VAAKGGGTGPAPTDAAGFDAGAGVLGVDGGFGTTKAEIDSRGVITYFSPWLSPAVRSYGAQALYHLFGGRDCAPGMGAGAAAAGPALPDAPTAPTKGSSVGVGMWRVLLCGTPECASVLQAGGLVAIQAEAARRVGDLAAADVPATARAVVTRHGWRLQLPMCAAIIGKVSKCTIAACDAHAAAQAACGMSILHDGALIDVSDLPEDELDALMRAAVFVQGGNSESGSGSGTDSDN
jgi:hypothetical protein